MKWLPLHELHEITIISLHPSQLFCTLWLPDVSVNHTHTSTTAGETLLEIANIIVYAIAHLFYMVAERNNLNVSEYKSPSSSVKVFYL